MTRTPTTVTTQTIDAISRALERLGDDRNSVAQFLRNRNIKGRRNAARSCPVARYLQGEFPDVERIVVNTSNVIVNSADRVETPSSVRRFITAFDNFTYSDLRE